MLAASRVVCDSKQPVQAAPLTDSSPKKEVRMYRPFPSILYPLFSILFFLTLSPGCNKPAANHDIMIAAAKELDSRWVETFNRGDVDGLMDVYWNNPALLVYPSDAMELLGWEQVRNSYSRTMSNMKQATATLSDTRYTVAGDVVICYGKWTIVVPTEEGPIFEIHGRYSDVKAERDGKWVIVMEHGSVPMPPPPDAEITM